MRVQFKLDVEVIEIESKQETYPCLMFLAGCEELPYWLVKWQDPNMTEEWHLTVCREHLRDLFDWISDKHKK